MRKLLIAICCLVFAASSASAGGTPNPPKPLQNIYRPPPLDAKPPSVKPTPQTSLINPGDYPKYIFQLRKTFADYPIIHLILLVALSLFALYLVRQLLCRPSA